MIITILADNNCLIDHYYLAEPALSLYIEDDERKILFDTGYSDVFLRNSDKMKIDLSQVNTLVLSHGHDDHTGGLKYFQGFGQHVELIAHPNVDQEKIYRGKPVGSPVKINRLPENFHVHLLTKPAQISRHLTYLGEIPALVQARKPLGDDQLLDDSALVYQDEQGIFIITGCSHSGICNIVEYAMQITGKRHIYGILGGFHLLNDPGTVEKVSDYLKKQDIGILMPCHCTDFNARRKLAEKMNVLEVGVGSKITL